VVNQNVTSLTYLRDIKEAKRVRGKRLPVKVAKRKEKDLLKKATVGREKEAPVKVINQKARERDQSGRPLQQSTILSFLHYLL
jgi:hypothetical protein